MRLGIIGGGTVGRALARTFIEHVDELRVSDALPERSTHDLGDTLETDLIFLCLPEAQVEPFFADRTRGGVRPYAGANYAIRSTTPIGTTRRLREKYDLPNVVHSPEFLTSRCAYPDAAIPARQIVGGPICECAAALGRLYERRFPGVPVLYMSSDESEAVKLMLNAAFAAKVSLFNEYHEACERLGLSWEAVRRGILSDGRITAHHTEVPGRDGFGCAGSCLPKDTAALALQMERAGVRPTMLAAAMARNLYDRGRAV